MMNEEALKDLAAYIKEKLDAEIADAVVAYGELTLIVDRADIVPVLTFLRDDVQCQFVCFTDISGADYPARARRFDVVYQLLSPRNRQLPRYSARQSRSQRGLLKQKPMA